MVRGLLVAVADHREERKVLLLAVDRPLGVEDLVAAVFGVRLREHHQLDVARVAAQLGEAFEQVVHFVGGEREAQLDVRAFQRLAALRGQGDGLQRGRGPAVEERRGARFVAQHDLHHAVVEDGGGLRARLFGPLPFGGDREAAPAFQPDDRVQPADARDVRRLGGPGGDRPEPREHQEGLALLRAFGREGGPVAQELFELGPFARVQLALHVGQVDEAPGEGLGLDPRPGQRPAHLFEQTVLADRGKAGGAGKKQHDGPRRTDSGAARTRRRRGLNLENGPVPPGSEGSGQRSEKRTTSA